MRKIFASMTAVSMAAAVMLAGCGSNSSDKITTSAASSKATEAATEKKTERRTRNNLALFFDFSLFIMSCNN